MVHEVSLFQGCCFLLWGHGVGWWTEPLGGDCGDLKWGLEQPTSCSLSSDPFTETTHPPGLMKVSVLLKEQLLINMVRMSYLIPPMSGSELISGSCVRPCALEKSHPRIHKWEERMMWCRGRIYERKRCQCDRAKVKENCIEMYHSSGSWWMCKVCTSYWEYPALSEKGAGLMLWVSCHCTGLSGHSFFWAGHKNRTVPVWLGLCPDPGQTSKSWARSRLEFLKRFLCILHGINGPS